jgi:uncharacterized ParB-like nuclease family protein
MRIIPAEQFKKQFGESTYNQLGASGTSKTVSQPSQPNYLQRVGSDIGSAFNDATQAVGRGAELMGEGKPGQGAIRSALGTAGAFAKGVVSPIMEAPGIKQATDFVGENVAKLPIAQKYAEWAQKHPDASKEIENILDITALTGIKPVGNILKTGAEAGIRTGKEAVETGLETAGKAVQPITNAIKDVTPTSSRIISSNVTKALDFTPADTKNILLSTGNDVGEFMAKNNLIGGNVESTKSLLDDFYKQNYKTVRDEISKVKTVYNADEVPRYKETLKSLYSQTTGVPGLEQSANEIKTLFQKKKITLGDVQRAKELIDKHSNLYKVTGDVKEGLQKQGLANVRKDLRAFIEKEVKDNTGADIRALNNQVQTSRDILDTITQRSTRGLTRYNLTLRDLGLFTGGSFIGSPLFGMALVFVKKLSESPSVRLKIAKFIDQLSDASKARIEAELKAGKIPQDLNRFIKKPPMVKGSQTTMPLDKLTSYEGAPDKKRVLKYMESIKAGKKIKPIKIMKDKSGKYGIEDGKHRYEAYRRLGKKDIPVEDISKKPKSLK